MRTLNEIIQSILRVLKQTKLFYFFVVWTKILGKPILHATFLLTFLNLLFFCGCNLKKGEKGSIALREERKILNEKYPKIPSEEMLQQISENKVYTELQDRYRASLSSMKSITEDDCVKLLVVIISPEVGKSASLANTYGIPYILETCSSLNIDCVDLTNIIAAKDPNEITLLPEDIHWSKNGSVFIASLFSEIIKKYANFRCTKVFPDSLRPKLLGDLPPNSNEVISGEKALPYRQVANAQGLRMNHNLSFPKKKQTIVFLGNANIYSPYLDNDFIFTELLQRIYPGMDIVNAAMDKYTIDDQLSLYADKIRYIEPDLLIVCTDGNDILNYFFTQRNHFSRLPKAYPPSRIEKKFYSDLFNSNTTN